MSQETEQKRVIHVRLDGERYPLRVQISQESDYRFAVEDLDRAASIYKRRFAESRDFPPYSFLAMAAIDAAYRARTFELSLKSRDMTTPLRELNELAERVLFVSEPES